MSIPPSSYLEVPERNAVPATLFRLRCSGYAVPAGTLFRLPKNYWNNFWLVVFQRKLIEEIVQVGTTPLLFYQNNWSINFFLELVLKNARRSLKPDWAMPILQMFSVSRW